MYSLETTSPLSSFTYFNGSDKDSHYNNTPEITYDSYDNQGNILQITGKDGMVTSYLWNNYGQYPMAQVKGASYSQIRSQNGKVPGYNSLTLYNSLNALAPTALINTYSYQPLFGMISQTDPCGLTKYYEYDPFGRLKTVLDDNHQVTSYYKYHYRGETTPPPPATTLTLSLDHYDFGINATGISVAVTSNSSWTISGVPSWLSVTPLWGSGNGNIGITCQANDNPSARTADIIVSTNGISRTIGIYQPFYDYSLSAGYNWPSHLVSPDYNPLMYSYTGIDLWYIFGSYESYNYETIGLQAAIDPDPVSIDVMYYNSTDWLDLYYDDSSNQLMFCTKNYPGQADWAVITIGSHGVYKNISVKYSDY